MKRVRTVWRGLDWVDRIALGFCSAVVVGMVVAAPFWGWPCYLIAAGWLLVAWMGFPRDRHTIQAGPKPGAVNLTTRRPPTAHDAEWHYHSAQYWLRVAEEVGSPMERTATAAALSQAHAAAGTLAHRLATHIQRFSA